MSQWYRPVCHVPGTLLKHYTVDLSSSLQQLCEVDSIIITPYLTDAKLRLREKYCSGGHKDGEQQSQARLLC